MKEKRKHKIHWSLISLLLAALTLWAVFSQSKDLNPIDLLRMLEHADRRWLLASVAAMMGFIIFEGEALLCLLRHLNYPRSHRSGFLYSAADVYFSAITPSASGGQPASALFMIREGVSGAVVTVVLLWNLVMYTLAILTVGAGILLFFPEVFMAYPLPGRLLILIGFLVLALLALLFWGLLKRSSLLYNIGARCILLLHRLRLMRHPEHYREKLSYYVEEYRTSAEIAAGHRKMLFMTYFWDLLQRISQISVTVLMHMALSGDPRLSGKLWATQTYAAIGSNCVPIPGGMGVADYLMLEGFKNLFPPDYTVQLALLSRSMSFYLCIIISGLTVLAGYLFSNKKRK